MKVFLEGNIIMFVDDLTIDDTVVGKKPDIRTKICPLEGTEPSIHIYDERTHWTKVI